MIIYRFGCERSILSIHRCAHEASRYSGINIKEDDLTRSDKLSELDPSEMETLAVGGKEEGTERKSVWVEE